MDVAGFRELLGPVGQELLEAVFLSYEQTKAVEISNRMRKEYPAELVAIALTQAALRKQARAKFGDDAARMYFTRDGLEQATPRAVAEHRAGRIASRGVRTIADLCCGIGGDLIALAGKGLTTIGVDRDELTVEIATANLEALGLSGRVEEGDVVDYDRAKVDAVVSDPARRGARGRVFDPQAYSPPWSWVEELLEGDACVKTAPIIPHNLVPASVEAEWVSVGGEVKEAAMWSGRLAIKGVRRRATVLAATWGNSVSNLGELGEQDEGTRWASWGNSASLTDRDDPGEAPVTEPKGFLYEPDGAVIRAGLVTAVAPLVEGSMLHPRIAYLTSDREITTPFAKGYRVREVLPYEQKKLKRTLQAKGIGTLTVKKRGVDLDPAEVRKRLVGKGPNAATLVITRTDAGTIALLVDPV